MTGTLLAIGGACNFIAKVQLTRTGDLLSGTASIGSASGALRGALVASDLRLVVDDIPGGGVQGRISLHRQ
ncbi:MAG TPA: hypothetical protein VKH43_02675 [Thermoanaerobaculia bacterium]|nr:hypothetical protein [Thermoanaerobaculia bacterium]